MDYELSSGGHKTREDGMCAMEWVAYLAGENHTDHPRCVAAPLASLLRQINDNMTYKGRQKLRPYLVRTIGTAFDGKNWYGKVKSTVGHACFCPDCSPKLWKDDQTSMNDKVSEVLDELLPLEYIELPEDKAKEYQELCLSTIESNGKAN